MPRYCAGLVQSGTRPLSEEERTDLEARRQRARFLTWLWLALGLMGLPLLLINFALATFLKSGPALFGLLTLASLALLAYAPLRWIDARKVARSLHADRDATTVEVYAPRPDDPLALETAQEALRGATRLEAGDATTIERLPRSGMVYRVDGRPLKPWIALQAVEVAEAPEPSTGMFPERAGEADLVPGLDLPRRRLSMAEAQEIERYRRRLVAVPGCLTLLLLIYPFFVLVALAAGKARGSSDGFRLVLFTLLAAWNLMSLLRAIRLYRRLGADVTEGWVLRIELDEEQATAAGWKRAESLPASRLAWTIDGGPAAWRRHTQATR